jgi:hypothetical protein
MADVTATRGPRRGRHARPARARAASALSVPAIATGQSGEPDYAAGPVAGHAHWLDTVAVPRVAGSPPWGPAPKPPGQVSS